MFVQILDGSKTPKSWWKITFHILLFSPGWSNILNDETPNTPPPIWKNITLQNFLSCPLLEIWKENTSPNHPTTQPLLSSKLPAFCRSLVRRVGSLQPMGGAPNDRKSIRCCGWFPDQETWQSFSKKQKRGNTWSLLGNFGGNLLNQFVSWTKTFKKRPSTTECCTSFAILDLFSCTCHSKKREKERASGILSWNVLHDYVSRF